ncbi:MAG: alpha/beta fold hydrolase [bacterium]|nr:alpha/beta fold hydrolase [bacterium]
MRLASEAALPIRVSRVRYIRRLMLFAVAAPMLGLFVALSSLSIQYAQALAHPRRLLPDADILTSFGVRHWQEVTFTTADGLRLDGWFIPPASSNGAALLFVHGHGSNRTHFAAELPLFLAEGYGALMFDLRNHGTSEGTVTTMGLLEVEDVVAAYRFLAAQPTVDPRRIGLYGASMGGATAILAMARLPEARLLVTDAAYASFPDLVSAGIRSVSGLPRFPFGDIIIGWMNLQAGRNLYTVRPLDAIPLIAPRPVLFMHGTDDATVPFRHGQWLYTAAHEPKFLYSVQGGGHGGLMTLDPVQYREQVIAFVNRYLRDG